MSVSLNPTKLPDIVSHVGVCFFFFFLEVDNCLERLHQLKTERRKQETQPGCTCAQGAPLLSQLSVGPRLLLIFGLYIIHC